MHLEMLRILMVGKTNDNLTENEDYWLTENENFWLEVLLDSFYSNMKKSFEHSSVMIYIFEISELERKNSNVLHMVKRSFEACIGTGN